MKGDLATANQPMLTVMNLSRLIAKAHIPQVEARNCELGMRRRSKLPAWMSQ